MDRRERHQEGQSFQFVAKGLAASFALLASLVSCSHKNTLPAGLQEALSSPTAPVLDVSSYGIQLTKAGSNSSPFLSANGQKMVFISRKRPSHQQGQVYFYDLENLKERRITYQDGECQNPILLKNGDVLYASTTDELKEHPPLLDKNPTKSPYPLMDLYMSELSGDEIVRLTHQGGFDGLPWPRPDKPDLVLFSKWNGKFLEIHQLNLKTKQSSLLLSKKDRSIESLRLSPNGKEWAWIERLGDNSTQVVTAPLGFQASKEKVLTLPKGDYKELTWAQNGRLLMSAKTLKKYYQIYSFDLEKGCLQNVFEANSDLSSPQYQADRQALIFASGTAESSQIFYKSLTTSDQCLKWEETPKN